MRSGWPSNRKGAGEHQESAATVLTCLLLPILRKPMTRADFE